jgi:hypothetical protein
MISRNMIELGLSIPTVTLNPILNLNMFFSSRNGHKMGLYCINVFRHTLFMVTSKQIDEFFGDVTDDVSPHNLHILFSLGFTTSTKRPAV